MNKIYGISPICGKTLAIELLKAAEGTIITLEGGYRYRFSNGRWEAMCHIEMIE